MIVVALKIHQKV